MSKKKFVKNTSYQVALTGIGK